MGAKSKRKTKLKHQDFQKAKLKVGKKLPKAQNETRTNFKSRAIVIREQLRMPTTGPPGVDDEKPAKKESKCKYSVKELLTQSHHYNVNKRSSALINIRELFVKNKPLIEVHLSAIIEHLGAMCIDAEGDVRKAWLRLIRIVLSYCKLDVMQPYRSVLCAHLRCAMTHINEEVRRDSLNLLDIYLDCFPQIVVSVNAQVLSCFVSQISRDASKDGGPTPSGQTTMEKRMLLADPGSFVATQKWRLAVLLRLKRFLQVLYNQSVSGATASNTFHEVECDMERLTHAQPFTQDHRDAAAGLGYVKPLSSQSELSASEHETLTDLMQKLFPLLVEIWTEISPQCQHRVEDFTQAGILSVDGFNILDSVLSVFNYLIKLTSSSTESVRHEENLAVIQQWNRFRHRSDCEDVSNLSAGSHLASYEEDFYRRFVQHFPYCIAAMPDEEKKLHANKLQTSELSLNLTICAIVTYLLSANQNADLPYGRQLVDYIIESINDNNITMNSEQIKIVLNITKQMLTKKMEKKNNKEMVIQLLHGIMVVYRKQTTMTTEKRLIIDFFYSILASGLPCHNETYFVNILQVWHTSLPYFLAKPRQLDVTFADVSKLVTIIRQAVNKYNCKATKQQLLKYSLQIMGSLPLYSSSIQRNVMSLILCFDELRKEHFKVLAQVALNMKRFPLENVSYLIEVLIYKYSLLKQESGLFLSFLLSLISGSMQTDLRRLNEVLSESSAHISQQIHYGGITEGQWKRTTSVARICCQYIYGMNRHEDHITILYSAFSTICVDHTYLPLCTAHNLLYAVSVLNTHYCTQPSDVVQSMLERLLVQILKLIDSLLLISVSGDCIVMAGKREKKKFPEVRETNPNLGVSEGDLSTTENMEVDDTEPATGPSSEPVTDPQANLHTISDNIKAQLQQTCISVLMSDVRWHSQTFLQAFIQQQIQNVKATQDLSVVLRRLCFVLTRLRQQKYRSLTSEENKQFSIMALLIQEQSKTVAVDDAILSDFNYECKLIMK